jgi:hypothetical protein
MNDKKYTMPREGNTERGDEFLHVVQGDRPVWMDVPEDSIGQPVEGWIIRRPVPVATGESALSDTMEIMKGLERQIVELGLKFAIYREELHGPCLECIAEPPPAPTRGAGGCPTCRYALFEESEDPCRKCEIACSSGRICTAKRAFLKNLNGCINLRPFVMVHTPRAHNVVRMLRELGRDTPTVPPSDPITPAMQLVKDMALRNEETLASFKLWADRVVSTFDLIKRVERAMKNVANTERVFFKGVEYEIRKLIFVGTGVQFSVYRRGLSHKFKTAWEAAGIIEQMREAERKQPGLRKYWGVASRIGLREEIRKAMTLLEGKSGFTVIGKDDYVIHNFPTIEIPVRYALGVNGERGIVWFDTVSGAAALIAAGWRPTPRPSSAPPPQPEPAAPER